MLASEARPELPQALLALAALKLGLSAQVHSSERPQVAAIWPLVYSFDTRVLRVSTPLEPPPQRSSLSPSDFRRESSNLRHIHLRIDEFQSIDVTRIKPFLDRFR